MTSNPGSAPTGKLRRPYRKPQVETIALRPKETVLGACKSQSIQTNSGNVGFCELSGPCTVDTP